MYQLYHKKFFTLTSLIRAIQTYPDHPRVHEQLFKCYKGFDWYTHVRYHQHVSCTLSLCDINKRTLSLVGLSPGVFYPLKTTETLYVLEGTGLFDYTFVHEHTVHSFYNTKNKPSFFINNSKEETSILCFSYKK